MAGGQERVLRKRIRSIQSTKKITQTFERIAQSRVKRAENAILATRPYVDKMSEVVARLSTTPGGREHPVFRRSEDIKRVAVIVIAADRGLCGPYNSNVGKAAAARIAEHTDAGREVEVITVGKKAANFLRFRSLDVDHAFTGMADRPDVEDASKVVETVIGRFQQGELDQIDLIHTYYASMASQKVEVRPLVPVEIPESELKADEDSKSGIEGFVVDYEYEPDPEDLLDRILPSWMRGVILSAMLSATASEQASRQRAMKAATDNADEMITNLTRVMNRVRQEAITTEIMEIIGGAEALRASSDRTDNFAETYGTPMEFPQEQH